MNQRKYWLKINEFESKEKGKNNNIVGKTAKLTLKTRRGNETVTGKFKRGKTGNIHLIAKPKSFAERTKIVSFNGFL